MVIWLLYFTLLHINGQKSGGGWRHGEVGYGEDRQISWPFCINLPDNNLPNVAKATTGTRIRRFIYGRLRSHHGGKEQVMDFVTDRTWVRTYGHEPTGKLLGLMPANGRGQRTGRPGDGTWRKRRTLWR